MAVKTGILSAAYQGAGWQPRQKSLSQDIIEGTIWSHYCSNSEWGFLKAVLLYIPAWNTPVVKDVNSIQHLSAINYSVLHNQMTQLVDLYHRLGIEVCLIDSSIDKFSNKAKYFYNLMYARDLFLMTPEGAIIARMASTVRAGEEWFVTRTLANLGVPIIRTIGGTGTFEGADALWVDARKVLIGTGNRTNRSGFEQVANCLTTQGISAFEIALPTGIQHLLGVLQIVDKDLAVVRSRIVTSHFKATISDLGFRLIELDETEEIRNKQAMNFVVTAPRQIMMAAGNPGAKHIYKDNGIDVVAESDVTELLKGAGGLGCATGILYRQNVVAEE